MFSETYPHVTFVMRHLSCPALGLWA